MNWSIYTADRATHLKIVVVGLAAALLIAVIVYTTAEIDRIAESNRRIAAGNLRASMLAHRAQSAAQAGAAELYSLFLLADRASRAPVYAEIDRNNRLRDVTREMQRYVGIKTVMSLAIGLLAGIWVGVLGLDFPVLWGFLAFLLHYIPNIGAIIAAVPPNTTGNQRPARKCSPISCCALFT